MVDGVMGKNTAGALNYYTSYTHKDDLSKQGIGVYDPNRRDIDGALYNYIVTHGVYNRSGQGTNTSQSVNNVSNGGFYYRMGGSYLGADIPLVDLNPIVQDVGKGLDKGSKALDDWGYATWVNDPIPSTPNGLGYLDNAAAGLAMGLGKAGEAIAKTLIKAEKVVEEVKGVGKVKPNGSRVNWGNEHGVGNVKHNNAIEDELDWAQSQGATDLKKNGVQRDINGNRVYNSNGNYVKPDASYNLDGKRYNTNNVSNYELDNIDELNREIANFKKMNEADPNAVNSLRFKYNKHK